MKVNGFNMVTSTFNIFVASDRKNITDGAAIEVWNKFQNWCNDFENIDDSTIKWVKRKMVKATYELVETENGCKYHKIEYAGGSSYIPVNDKSAIIIL